MFNNYIDELPDVLTVDQLIDFLPLGRSKIYDLVKSNVIKSVRVGRKYIIPKKFLLDFLFGNFYNEDTHLTIEPTNTVSLIESEVVQ